MLGVDFLILLNMAGWKPPKSNKKYLKKADG